METISYILLGLCVPLLVFNMWMFKRNIEYEVLDGMGSGINYSIGTALISVLLGVGVLVHPSFAWWWAPVVFVACFLILSLVVKPIFSRLLKLLGVAGKTGVPPGYKQ